MTGDQFEESRPGEPETPARRSPLRWILVGAAAFVVAALVLVVTVFSGDSQQTAQAGGAAQPTASAAGQDDASAGFAAQQPGTVSLPGGGVAKLIRQELTADGTLPIPQGLDEATWWGSKLGAEHGVALLSGHVNWKGKKGPFDELWRLKDGQDITIADTAGGHWVYRISEISTIHKDELAARSEELFSQDGPHRLVLVTCGGDYVGGTEGYEDNRIVSASLVSRP